MKTTLLFAALAGMVCFSARLSAADDPLAPTRNKMVDQEIVAAGVKDPRVIAAVRATPRHEFVPADQRPYAYYDMALPIGNSQTISPPFVVAYMTEQLDPQPTDKVLEIGTGSGYQAAVMSSLVKDVYTIEIVQSLGERAARTLKRLGYPNVHTRIGDGYAGWPDAAPFDKIIVTCSPEKVPEALVGELREGGRLIVPVGQRYQQTLYLFEKRGGKLVSTALLPTLFVPMTGTAEAGREVKPDPANPQIVNGGFETLATNAPPARGLPSDHAAVAAAPVEGVGPRPVGWHYQRKLELVESKDAPEGKHFVRFLNNEPGRATRALQGLAVDGRRVAELDFSLWIRGQNMQRGRSLDEQAVFSIVFFDESRAMIGENWMGPWHGTFGWKKEATRMLVPFQAREAGIRIGMHGGIGELDVDDIQVTGITGQVGQSIAAQVGHGRGANMAVRSVGVGVGFRDRRNAHHAA